MKVVIASSKHLYIDNQVTGLLNKCHLPHMYMFCTIRIFIPYAYGTYHTRIRIWYDHMHMVRIIVPYAYGAYETTGVYGYS